MWSHYLAQHPGLKIYHLLMRTWESLMSQNPKIGPRGQEPQCHEEGVAPRTVTQTPGYTGAENKPSEWCWRAVKAPLFPATPVSNQSSKEIKTTNTHTTRMEVTAQVAGRPLCSPSREAVCVSQPNRVSGGIRGHRASSQHPTGCWPPQRCEAQPK